MTAAGDPGRVGFRVALVGKGGAGKSAIAGTLARVLALLHEDPLGRNAAVIGTCVSERPGSIILDTGFGRRLLAEPDGEPLPRIC